MQYSKFLYQPFSADTVKALEKYPEFKFKVPDKQKAIDYLILLYDISSNEVKASSDRLYERKKFAALKAGFKVDKQGHFSEWVEDIIVGENDEFNDAMVRFVRFFALPDLPALTAYNEMIDHEFTSAAKEKDSKLIKVILANIDELREKIETLERKIFTGDETENVRKALYRLMEKQRLPRPENVAQDIESRELKVSDPYNFQDEKI